MPDLAFTSPSNSTTVITNPGPVGASRVSVSSGGPDLLAECGQRGPQVSNRLIWGGAITHRTDTWPELGGRTPYTVFILFHRVGHVNDAAHALDSRRSRRSGA